MKQLHFIKQLRIAIATCMLLLVIVIFTGCNDSSTNSTEVADSTTNRMSDTSTVISTDTTPKFDSLQNRTDTSRSDQTPPPPR